MDRDEYEDYLVDTARRILRRSNENPTESRDAKELLQDTPGSDPNGPDDTVQLENDNRDRRRTAHEQVSDAKSAADRDDTLRKRKKEADFLARRHNTMDNTDLERFLSGTSEFHEHLRDADDLEFSDWENRILITGSSRSVEELADELDRDVGTVRLQMKLLGLDR